MEKEISKAIVSLLIKYPFYANLALQLNIKQDELCPTFGTDGSNLYWSEQGMALFKNDLPYVMAHEVLHLVNGTIWRVDKRDKFLWNIATDIEIYYLLKNDFTSPKAIVDIIRVIETEIGNCGGKNAELIYSLLQKRQDESSGEGKQGEDKQSHAGVGPDIMNPAKDTSAQEWLSKAIEVAEAISRQRGSLPGNIKELLEQLKEVRIPLEDIIRSIMTSRAGSGDYRWLPPNKKYLYQGIYLPGQRLEEVELLLAIDDSGSISSKELVEFFSIIKQVADTYGNYTIHLFICDTQVNQEFTLRAGDEFPDVAIGRGGTDFRPVFKRIEELYLTHLPLIYATDLEGVFPDRYAGNVLWVIPPKARLLPVPFGKVERLIVN